MANIMSQLKLKNNTSRNAFDLSRKNAFTAKIGELLPVACIECIPGDKIKGKIQHFTRTVPVNTAAYTRIREYYDWFFVPTNLLWNKFNTFVTQMVDNNQHATSINDSQVLTSQHPYFTTNQIAHYLSSIQDAPTNPNIKYNIFNYNRGLLSAKLLHYLGYGDFFLSARQEATQSFRINANLNPFPLLAYQKIYQDYFRNSQWEKAYAPAFNIDYISGSAESLNIPIGDLITNAPTIENMFDLRYANWNKDKFMGLLPNAQYGDSASIISDVSGDSSDFTNLGSMYIKTRENSLFSNQVLVVPDINSSQNFYEMFHSYISSTNVSQNGADIGFNTAKFHEALTNLGVGGSFTILALRQAEALQKWREITQSQQQDYKNQIEAHFGVSMSDAYSERCKYIDGHVSSLDISEVTNTNLADNNAAEIAGKGVGVGDGSINFKSDVHGYLMCIYHATPLLDYSLDGVNRMNLKTYVTDYAIPEFDKTGMVQVPLIELTNSPDNPTFAPELLGYAPRYYDYKTSVDEVHGGFYNGGENIENWVAPVDKSYITKYIEAMHGDGTSIGYQWFKINPAVLNPIFGIQVTNDYTNNPTGTYDDQLYINASVELTAVRNLDRNGLPY